MGLFKSNKNNKHESNADIFLNYMENMFGEPYAIRKAEADDGGNPVNVLFWRDLPEEGTLTSVNLCSWLNVGVRI